MNTYLELKKLTTLKEQRAQTSKQKNSRACSLYTEDKARGSRAKQKPFRQQHSFSQTPRTLGPPQPHQQRWTEHLDFQPQPQSCGVRKAEQAARQQRFHPCQERRRHQPSSPTGESNAWRAEEAARHPFPSPLRRQ